MRQNYAEQTVCDPAGQEPVQAGAAAASGPGTSPPTEAGAPGRSGELPRIEKPPEMLAFEAAKEVGYSSVQRHNTTQLPWLRGFLLWCYPLNFCGFKRRCEKGALLCSPWQALEAWFAALC